MQASLPRAMIFFALALCLTRVSAGEWFFVSVGDVNDPAFARRIADEWPVAINQPGFLWSRVDYFPHEVSAEPIFPNSFYWRAAGVDVPVWRRDRGLLLD